MHWLLVNYIYIIYIYNLTSEDYGLGLWCVVRDYRECGVLLVSALTVMVSVRVWDYACECGK